MACGNHHCCLSSSSSSSSVPCITAAASQVLNELERLRQCPDESLPVPFVFRLISDLLLERFSVDCSHAAGPTSMTPSRPLSKVDDNLCSKKVAPPVYFGEFDSSEDSGGEDEDRPQATRWKKFKADLKKIRALSGPLYVDIQYIAREPNGSDDQRTLVVKEFAVTCCGTDTVAWITVQPPRSAVPAHGAKESLRDVPWDEGDVDVDKLRVELNKVFDGHGRTDRLTPRVYIRGSAKVDVLVKDLMARRNFIYPLELRQDYVDVHKACPYHKRFTKTTPCAMRNALALKSGHSKYKWLWRMPKEQRDERTPATALREKRTYTAVIDNGV